MSAGGPLKIAFVADTINGRSGGGVLVARNVIDELRKRHEVIEVGADADGAGRLPGYHLPFTAARDMDFVMARPDRHRLETLFAGVDVVHLQFPFPLSQAALAAARATGRPVVAAFHVQPENALLNVRVRSRWLTELVYRRWIRHLYARVDAVVAPTAFAAGKLREHGLTTPVTVISNGVPPDLHASSAEREPGHEGLFLVLMAGRLGAEKRQEDLLEAVRRSRHRDRIQVVMAGAGPRQAALTALAATLPRPVEIGFLPRERLVRLFHTADLFVHCSEIELEGIAVIEAMSVGLPALVAQSPESAASAFALDDDFRFPVGDVEALGRRLDYLIEQPEVLARASEAYREAGRRLDFDASLERLVGLYRSVIAAAATRANLTSPEGMPRSDRAPRAPAARS
jgi:1,2-diacylglycerol 3-alpha-glucosyltransferase